MRESQIEKFLIKKVKDVGGEVRKVEWIGRKGAPDRLVMLPPRDREENPTIWVELKNPDTIKTFPADARERAQHREHQRMRNMGQRVEVIGTLAGVEELLA